jgi:hypothetical protein
VEKGLFTFTCFDILLYVYVCNILFYNLKVDSEEVMYIVKELWRGRSARDQSQKDTGRKMWRSVNELMLVLYASFSN